MAYVIVSELCTKDNLCFDACPEGSIAPEQGDAKYEGSPSLYINPETCTDCSACVAVCPSDAIYLEEDVPADYPNAAAEFQKVMNVYGSSPEVPEAMWQLATAFVKLQFCTDAKALLNDLVKRFPKSHRASDAKSELKTIAKLPRAACTS